MDIKKARALVESREKLDPDYKEAVAMCIEGDKIKDVMKIEKPKVEEPRVKESKVKTEVKDAGNQ